MLIILGGLPGSGKTTIARELAGQLGAVHLRIDSIEQLGSRAVIGFSWSDREDKRHNWAHVLELREGKIFAIKDYASPSRAALARGGREGSREQVGRAPRRGPGRGPGGSCDTMRRDRQLGRRG